MQFNKSNLRVTVYNEIVIFIHYLIAKLSKVYLVNNHADCCERASLLDPIWPAFSNTWVEQGNGVWQINGTTAMTSADAQSHCCN